MRSLGRLSRAIRAWNAQGGARWAEQGCLNSLDAISHSPAASTSQLLAPWWSLQQAAAFRATIQNQGKAKKKAAAGAAGSSPAVADITAADQQAGTNDQQATPGVPSSLTTTKDSLLRISETSPQLTSEHIGNYYQLQPKLMPEAFQALHQTFLAPRGTGEHPRAGGCAGLQAEVKAVGLSLPASTPFLMHREFNHHMWDALSSSAHQPEPGSSTGLRLLLQGPAGAGKSCAVLAAVERARASGWLCVYVPSATSLISGGFFVPRASSPAAPQQWDTPMAAQHILLGTQQAHAAALARLPARLPETLLLLRGKQQAGAAPTLDQLLTLGLAADDAHTPVDMVLALIAELTALASPSQPVLFAVDSYNVLYGSTDYGKHVQQEGSDGSPPRTVRVPLTVTELRLANAFRFLDQPSASLGQAHVLAAVTHNGGSLDKLVFEHGGVEQVDVPRYSQVEAAHALYHYYECGVCPVPPSESLVSRVMLLTNGNAGEIRRLAPTAGLLSTRKGIAPQLVL